MSLGPTLAEEAKYANAKIGFHAAFMDYLEKGGADPMMGAVLETSSEGTSEEYIFIGDLPGFEEWKDDRKMAGLAAHKLRIDNKNFANGVPIHRNEIMDDKLGIVGARLQQLAQKASRHKGALITQLMLNGFTGTSFPVAGDGLAYDGALFFSASHSLEGGPAQSNLMTAAFSESAVEAAAQRMQEFKTFDGQEPLELTPTTIIVGPKNEWNAKRLAGQIITVRASGDGGETNVHHGRWRVEVNKRLVGDYDDYWFMGALDEAIKPFIFQNREPITTAASVNWDSDDMFYRGKMKFGAQARYGVGYFDWRLMIGSTGAG